MKTPILAIAKKLSLIKENVRIHPKHDSICVLEDIVFYSLDTSGVIIGRGKNTYAATNKINIPDDDAISRLHATIYYSPQGKCYKIIDGTLDVSGKKSANGIYLNGKRVYSAILFHLDIITLCSYYIQFRWNNQNVRDIDKITLV